MMKGRLTRVGKVTASSRGEHGNRLCNDNYADVKFSFRYFAAEIVGGMLELEPRKWRKPRRVDYKRNKERASRLGNKFHKYDWTLQLKGPAGPA